MPSIHPSGLPGRKWSVFGGLAEKMANTVNKLGVRKPLGMKRKLRYSRRTIGGGFIRILLEGFKSVGKTLQAATDRITRVFAEFADTERRKPLLDWHESEEPISILPPARLPRKTIVLDLDETLVHSSVEPLPRYDFTVQANVDGETVTFYVLKRPGVDLLLKELGEKYELVLFTAAVEEYANPVLDRIDPRRTISYRLFRDSCREISGKYVKDLSLLGRDLRRVIIVDDNPNAYVLHPQNAIPVRSFVDDLRDRELASVISFSRVAADYEDLRDAIRYYFAVEPSPSPSQGK